MKCMYRGCGKSRRSNPRLSVYGFPVKDEQRCKQWITNSGNSLDVPLSKYELKGLCQDHFIREDFVNETKHRLIPIAVPLHFNDPLGLARRKEREKEFNRSETSDGDDGGKIKSSIVLKNDLQQVTDKSENSASDTKKTVISLREDLFPQNEYKLRFSGKKDKKVRCYVKKMCRKDDAGASCTKRRFQWLDEVLKRRALNKNKKVAYYVNINDLLASFDSSDSSEFEFRWRERRGNDNKKVRCYSRKATNTSSSSSQLNKDGSNKSIDTANDPLSLEECKLVKNETENNEKIWTNKDDCDINDHMSSKVHVWSWEEDKNHTSNNTDMLLSSEYQFMSQDVKDEGISECQFRWSEEEDDKSCIRIIDVSELQSEKRKERSKNEDVCVPRIYKKKIKRRQQFGAFKSTRRSPEREKFIYVINRNRALVRKLRNELRKCQKELKELKKYQTLKVQSEELPTVEPQQENKKLLDVEHLTIIHEPKILR